MSEFLGYGVLILKYFALKLHYYNFYILKSIYMYIIKVLLFYGGWFENF